VRFFIKSQKLQSSEHTVLVLGCLHGGLPQAQHPGRDFI